MITVARKKLAFDPFITFYGEDGRHDYVGQDGRQYTPVSTVLSTFTRKFDGQRISSSMSGGNIHVQNQLLKKWDDKRDMAASYGTQVHNALELYFKTGKVLPGFESIIEDIKGIISPYERVYPEFQFYSVDHCVSGTSDLPFVRKSLKVMGQMCDQLDIGDYKTNTAHGIRYMSSYWKEDMWKHKGYLLGPLSHLEDCEYNKYAMQLSIYAYMAEMTYHVVIGRLFLLYIGLNWQVQHIPVPYLKYEAKAVLDAYANLKKLKLS